MRVNFELTGLTSLLMHADDVAQADELKAWRSAPENKGSSVAGDDRSPAWTWQTYLYHDGTNVCVPTENIMVALRQAGAQVILKKQKTFKEITQSGIVPESEFADLTIGELAESLPIADVLAVRDETFEKQAEFAVSRGFRLFVKRATVARAKHVRVRARFDNWKLRGALLVTSDLITMERLKQLFDLAGNVGIGDWRPGCKTPGPYGRFTAKITKA